VLVLVVDDSADSRQLLADIITGMGLNVIRASNGPETLEHARAKHPDLIILDVSMPGMSGFEVCSRLKSDPDTAQIPILMLTALNDVENRVQGLKVGADDYLTKPYNPRELMERVRARLRAKQETDDLRKMQQIIRETFTRYVSPSVVERLLDDPTQVKLGGTLQDVTVLFADLEGFTSMSEQTSPERLLMILNQYLTMIVESVLRYGGTIDKFLGDGVMALFNTPLHQPDHAVRAVQTALRVRRTLPTFHQQFEPVYRMRINFGIHTGSAVVGNVGAPQLMDFTAVGDSVNLAARLQKMAEGGQILISSATYDAIGEHIATRPIVARSIGSMKLKGRVEEVMTYEVLDEVAKS
jgi:class 3 adenylate cyclase